MAKVTKGAKAQRYKAPKSRINLRSLARWLNIPRAARATRPAHKHLVVFLAFTFSAAALTGALWPKNQTQILKEKLIHRTDDFEAHLELAEKFLENNQLEEAEKTLRLAQNLQPTTNNLQLGNQVLGQQTSQKLEELWQQKHYSDPKDIRRLIAAWEKIVAEKPNYRDGWLQLTVLHYRLYENRQAKENLQKAIALDPNYEPTKELNGLLGN